MMKLTYEESGLVYPNEYDLEKESNIFTNKMIDLFKKDDTFLKKTSLKRAHTLSFLSNSIELVIFRIQDCLLDDDIYFSVEHYANFFSTLAYVLSLNVSLVKWEDFMLAFLSKCDGRGVTHKDVAIQTYVTRYAKNIKLLGNKKMNDKLIQQMLLSCEADLSDKKRISDSLSSMFVTISSSILEIKYKH